jgi:hypothetical protein
VPVTGRSEASTRFGSRLLTCPVTRLHSGDCRTTWVGSCVRCRSSGCWGRNESIEKAGNACYNSAENLSSSSLSKNLKIKMYRTIILPVILHGCETWSLTLREERRLRVHENRVLRRLFGPKRGVEKTTY